MEHSTNCASARVDRSMPDLLLPSSSGADKIFAQMPMRIDHKHSDSSCAGPPITCRLTRNDYTRPDGTKSLPEKQPIACASPRKQGGEFPVREASSADGGLNVNLCLNLQPASMQLRKTDVVKCEWPDCKTETSTPIAGTDKIFAHMPMRIDHKESDSGCAGPPITCLLTRNDYTRPDVTKSLPEKQASEFPVRETTSANGGLRSSAAKQWIKEELAQKEKGGLNVNLCLNLQPASMQLRKTDVAKSEWPDCKTETSTPIADQTEHALPGEASLSIKEIPVKFSTPVIPAPVKVQLQLNNPRLKNASCESQQVRQFSKPIILNINNWNGMPPEERFGFIEQLSERITKTMGLQVSNDRVIVDPCKFVRCVQ